MYLVISADGSIQKTNSVTEGDLDASEQGLQDVIDISDPEEPTIYIEGDWLEIETYDLGEE
jgi:hypothetical protein